MKKLNYKYSSNFLALFIAFFCYPNIIESEPIKTHTVFVPGITASTKNVVKYAKAGAFTDKKVYTGVIFPDQKKPKGIFNKIIYHIAKKKGKMINREKFVFGYGHDIATLKKKVDKAQQQNPGCGGVLFGTCRGGATIINYLAQNDAKWVKGIVLDATYADPNVMIRAHLSKTIAKIFFPKFKKNAQTPLSSIKSIKNKKIKVLMLYAKGNIAKGGTINGDRIVPYDLHTKLLYEAFKKEGFDVTLVGYDAVHCGGIDTEDDDGDRTAYTQYIQEWYKKYGFVE